ncbi:MAG: phytanoyl-CoA dioxygenase family protein, partial [Candidatus Sumerlaeota bacterium]
MIDSSTTPCQIDQFHSDGFEIHRGLVARNVVESLMNAVENTRNEQDSPLRGGIRNLLQTCESVREFVLSETMLKLAKSIVGEAVVPVRVIFFDKTPEANWGVPWHQDLNIAVNKQADVEGFGPWTIKDGVPHVVPPRKVLDQMVTMRVHLDDCGSDVGPLRVAPGTHSRGILHSSQYPKEGIDYEPVECTAQKGDLLMMSP